MKKISKKIIVKRLSYLKQISNMLDFDQIDERKNRSAIDAILNLTHDIQLILKQKLITLCLFLNVKKTFDHVSINQLLIILMKLNLFIQLKNWVNNFMNNWSIALTFDDQKQHTRQIKIDISQKSSISSILFFIYIRSFFSKIRIKIRINFFNFIDDIQINVSSKSIENNCKTLIKIIKIAFSWINANAIQFDGSKFELIHVESKKIMSINSIILSNKTILKLQNMIKWLKIWIDRKLTFKTHVEKRLIFAIKIFHSINRLQNFKWNLIFMITRQLYLTCSTAISDYDFEIWWNDQKLYAEKFQKLQNLKLRKILKIFKTSSILIMKIEINI